MATESVPAPLTVTLPLAGTPKVTVFAGVVASRATQTLVVVTHMLLNVPAPAAIVTRPLQGVIVTTPAVVDSAAPLNPSRTGLFSCTAVAPLPVSLTTWVGEPSIE